MREYLFYIWTVLFLLVFNPIEAQNVLLLQKPGKEKRFLYHTGDKISIRTGEPSFTVYGELSYIGDSLCTVNKEYTFPIAKVNEVVITRHFLSSSWRKLFAAAILYSGGSIINRALHNEKPLIDETIPVVSGSFIALGTTSLLLRYRRCRMADGWQLKVLDFGIFKEKNQVKED